MNKYDFGGYATKNDLKCSDGRVIRRDAFKDNDGMTVPLVWQHLHNDPKNVLGHAMLENRSDGMYAYCTFNKTAEGEHARMLVQHGDITNLSIYANGLVEKAKSVLHGAIREVSLVLSGANPGARIDNLTISHSDGSESDSEDEAIIYTDVIISLPKEELSHAEEETSEDKETVGDVFESLTDKQKTVVYALIAEISGNDDNSDVEHSDKEGDDLLMKKNVFDGTDDVQERPALTHAQFSEIMADAQKTGSFKEAFLAHVVTYGIENIDYLFPDARTLTNAPHMITRRMEWVSQVINGTHHTPFSRIKSLAADLTLEDARAKGYVKGALKKDEFFALSRRTTTPTTIYKKQKLDRDDIIDITDLDVVAWLKAEMRMMLDEEIARAILLGDGRAVESEDKINEANIRPIFKEADFYVHRVEVANDADSEDVVEAVIRAREVYNGSGGLTMFVTPGMLTDMLLVKATDGRRMYASQAELESTLRVSKIVEVQLMTGVTRTVDDVVDYDVNLVAILLNLKDYTVGADKGGSIAFFDDFDIDYNQYKYLLETRISGALTIPKSAIVIEKVAAAG